MRRMVCGSIGWVKKRMKCFCGNWRCKKRPTSERSRKLSESVIVLLYVNENVCVSADSEVYTHIARYAGLPYIFRFIIFFRPKRWVPNVEEQELHLLFERIAHITVQLPEFTLEMRSAFVSHLPGRFRSAISSSTVLNGPRVSPRLTSAKLARSHAGSFFALIFCVLTAREIGSTRERTSRTSRRTSVSNLSVLLRVAIVIFSII